MKNNTNALLQIKKLSYATSYELWHQRMGHCGQHPLKNLHKHAIGVPKLRGNAFYKCPSCMTRKICIKQPVGQARRKNTKQQHIETVSTPEISDEIQDDVYIPNTLPGKKFHMDSDLLGEVILRK